MNDNGFFYLGIWRIRRISSNVVRFNDYLGFYGIAMIRSELFLVFGPPYVLHMKAEKLYTQSDQ